MDEIKENNHDQRQWFIVNCTRGHEEKVLEDLNTRIKKLKLQDDIFDIRIAKEWILKSETSDEYIERKLFPGYIFINMIMSDDVWYDVRNCPGVTGFIGSSGKGTWPLPLPKKEVEYVLSLSQKKPPVKKIQEESSAPKKIFTADFKIGDYVRITEGLLKDKEGKVEAMDNERGIATISTFVFHNQTRIKIEYESCQKIII